MQVIIKTLLLALFSLHESNSFNMARTYGYISKNGDEDIMQSYYKDLINYRDTFTPTAEKLHQLKRLKNSSQGIPLINEDSETERKPLTVLQELATLYSENSNNIEEQERRNALGKDYKDSSYASFVNGVEDKQVKSDFMDQFGDDVGDDVFVDNSNNKLLNRIFDWIKTSQATDLNINTNSDIQNEVKRGDKRPQRDVYSLLNEDFIKSHELGTETDIKRLLEALATIRDFLDKEKAAERRKAAKLLGPLTHRMGNNRKAGHSKPTKQRTNQNRQDLPRKNNDYQKQDKPEKWLNEKPRPTHQQDSRYKHYQKNEKSHRASRKGDVEFAPRTSHNNNVGKQVDNFYHPEFNPTGW